MTEIAFTEGGHYYDPITGLLYPAVATQPGAKNPYRAFDLRDARKVGAAPSVTTINGLLDKPGLRQYIRNRDIETALRMPTLINVQDKIERVKAEADERMHLAQEMGTAIHAGISLMHEGKDPTYATWNLPGCTDVVVAFWEWYKQAVGLGILPEITESEHSFISRYGFAGTVDAMGPNMIGDYKTQEFSTEAEANVYVEHPLQLAGYAIGTDQRDKPRFEIIISRNVPGLVKLHPWKPADNKRYDKAFMSLWAFWKHSKGYYPGGADWLRTVAARGRLPQSLMQA